MRLLPLFVALLAGGFSCQQPDTSCRHNKPVAAATQPPVASKQNPYSTIGEIPLPAGYFRSNTANTSFATWLRQLPLKKDKTVYLYNGQPKRNQTAQFAVLEVSVGEKDLQQCADAVMRLRAAYLFAQQQYNRIRFSNNAGVQYPFSPPYTRPHLHSYLQRVFGMCGTASLAKQLRPGAWDKLQPGDVLIRGGFPGHAVLVVDVAERPGSPARYLLAQSYMPAQDIHVLQNPGSSSPWYEVNPAHHIRTPEWTFAPEQLMTW